MRQQADAPREKWQADALLVLRLQGPTSLVRTGTTLESSKVPLRKWAVAIYLCLTSLKSVSSMKPIRDINVSQKTAWFMLRAASGMLGARIRPTLFSGPVEVDETYVGGLDRNRHKRDRKGIPGGAGKTRRRRCEGSAYECRSGLKWSPKSTWYSALTGLRPGERRIRRHPLHRRGSSPTGARGATTTRPSSGQRRGIRGRGMSFNQRSRVVLEHAQARPQGHLPQDQSSKHLNRYVQEFAGKHNFRESGTLTQMRDTVARLVGHRLLYRDLIAANGLPSLARR